MRSGIPCAPTKNSLGVYAYEATRGSREALEKDREAALYLGRLTREIKKAMGENKRMVVVSIPKPRLKNTEKNRLFVEGVQDALRDNGFSTKVCYEKRGEIDGQVELGPWRAGMLEENPADWDNVKRASLTISWRNRDPETR